MKSIPKQVKEIATGWLFRRVCLYSYYGMAKPRKLWQIMKLFRYCQRLSEQNRSLNKILEGSFL